VIHFWRLSVGMLIAATAAGVFAVAILAPRELAETLKITAQIALFLFGCYVMGFLVLGPGKDKP
jgi:hypothetical protein